MWPCQAYLSQVQARLSVALPRILECTDIQVVELRVTQQWLRAIAWKLCVTRACTDTEARSDLLFGASPIEISEELLSMTHYFPQQAMNTLGVALVS